MLIWRDTQLNLLGATVINWFRGKQVKALFFVLVLSAVLPWAFRTWTESQNWLDVSDTVMNRKTHLFAIMAPPTPLFTSTRYSHLPTLIQRLSSIANFREAALRAVTIEQNGNASLDDKPSWLSNKMTGLYDNPFMMVDMQFIDEPLGMATGIVFDTMGSLEDAQRVVDEVGRDLPFKAHLIEIGPGPFLVGRVPGYPSTTVGLMNLHFPFSFLSRYKDLAMSKGARDIRLYFSATEHIQYGKNAWTRQTQQLWVMVSRKVSDQWYKEMSYSVPNEDLWGEF